MLLYEYLTTWINQPRMMDDLDMFMDPGFQIQWNFH